MLTISVAYCGVMAIDDPAIRVRERIRAWMDISGLDQRAFAEVLGKSQVWLQKVLGGVNQVRLKDLDQIASAMRTTAPEIVRSPDDRYQLECTPTEVRLIEQLRRRPDLFEAIVILLNVRGVQKPPAASKNLTPMPARLTGKPRKSARE